MPEPQPRKRKARILTAASEGVKVARLDQVWATSGEPRCLVPHPDLRYTFTAFDEPQGRQWQ